MRTVPNSKACERTTAFTLIELLVVIAIIAILASLLLPAITRAKAQSLRIKCISNQHQIAIAYQLYTEDSDSSYPAHANWGTVGGRATNGTVLTHNAPGETIRPLNRYVGNIEVFRCPADRGDPFWPAAKTCWDGWGNSYLPMWSVDWYGVKHVTGDSKMNSRAAEAPMKMAEVAQKPTTKIVQGDWIWHGSRDLTTPKGIWHNYKGKRICNMLFGDSHVESYRFPADMHLIDRQPVNINWKWW
jgi:prepilin-type N-terminal cleavage/methylation domain-containing protein/prepilin-type processing-associated H-X9-DG protein